jgi:hypothetical protein
MWWMGSNCPARARHTEHKVRRKRSEQARAPFDEEEGTGGIGHAARRRRTQCDGFRLTCSVPRASAIRGTDATCTRLLRSTRPAHHLWSPPARAKDYIRARRHVQTH